MLSLCVTVMVLQVEKICVLDFPRYTSAKMFTFVLLTNKHLVDSFWTFF